MSILSEQVEELRETADRLDRTHDISSPWVHARLTPMMREAADTIEGLRDRLQADALSGTCEFKPFQDEDASEPNAMRGVCSECSALMHGKDNFCPNCGAKVVSA